MERTMKTLGFALLLIGLASCSGDGDGGGGGDGDGDGETKAITVTVAMSKASYAIDEQVELTVTLTNTGTEDCAVATVDEALEIASLTRGGAEVTSTTHPLRSELDLVARLDGSLVTLAPGAQTTIAMTSRHTGPGGQVLSTYGVGATDLETVTRALDATGAYAISIRYRYQGANPGGLPVLTTPTDPGSAAFTIDP